VIKAGRAEGGCGTKRKTNCCENVCVPPVENTWISRRKNEAGA